MWTELIMFFKTIDTKLTVFENINTLYYIVNFNPSKVIETFKCIKKAYNLYNELNKTNMLVVTKPME